MVLHISQLRVGKFCNVKVIYSRHRAKVTRAKVTNSRRLQDFHIFYKTREGYTFFYNFLSNFPEEFLIFISFSHQVGYKKIQIVEFDHLENFLYRFIV